MGKLGNRQPVLVIACGALAHELLNVISLNNWDHFKLECLPAKLHNRPEKIPAMVRAKIHESRAKGWRNIVVMYSDCGTGGELARVLEQEQVSSIGGAHCYEMFSGCERFVEINQRSPRAFYLTDFLVRHFDTLIYRGLGLDRFPQLQDVYFGNYRQIIYLTQLDTLELKRQAQAISAILNLKLEIIVTGYGLYRDFLQEVVKNERYQAGMRYDNHLKLR